MFIEKRYQVNDKLMEKNMRMKKLIKRKLAKSPIDIRKMLEKDLFGEKNVTWQDYQKSEQIIMKYLSRENRYLDSN